MDRGAVAVLSHRRFDVDEYTRMHAAGILSEDDRVELLDGEIVQMHAIGSRHLACVNRLNRLLVMSLGDRAIVSVQNGLHLDPYSMPQPDVAVLHPAADDYAGGLPKPEETFLLIEVADSSLRLDRTIKLPLYAAAEVREVWIADLRGQAIEVHRDPRGRSYELCERFTDGVVVPEAFPGMALAVEAILPPTR